MIARLPSYIKSAGMIVRNSIRLKLIFGVAFVHLVLMTVFVLDLVSRQKDFLIEEANRRAVNHAVLIADTASSWVIADDLIGMEEVLRSSAASGNLRYAMIVDRSGRVLAHTTQEWIGKYLRDTVSLTAINGPKMAKLIANDENSIYAAAPVIVDEHLIGWSLLALDTTATTAHLSYVTRAGVLYTLIAIIVGTLFAIFLARSILRQLSLMLSSVDFMGRNVLDKLVPIISADEVGRVAVALNNAMISLKTSRLEFENEMSERKKAEQDIRQLSRRLINTTEEERKRIAQDLHDEFGQALTGIQFGLKALEQELPDSALELKAKCHEMADSVERMGDSIDRVASDLRPAALDHLGLVPAVRSYLKDLSQRGLDLKIGFHAAGFRNRVHPAIELVCYRVIQEGLTNIIKHAQATKAEIQLTISHPNVILMISDNGRGFSESAISETSSTGTGGVGLSGMKERVASLDGKFEFRSKNNSGSVIRVELPVKMVDADA